MPREKNIRPADVKDRSKSDSFGDYYMLSIRSPLNKILVRNQCDLVSEANILELALLHLHWQKLHLDSLDEEKTGQLRGSRNVFS
jgi:hypothetical protein